MPVIKVISKLRVVDLELGAISRKGTHNETGEHARVDRQADEGTEGRALGSESMAVFERAS